MTLPASIDAEHWLDWKPVDVATLLFVRDRSQKRVLLIRKKRGLGAGKINGPGGRVDAGESIAAGAARELAEELLIEPGETRVAGLLRFQFLDGYSLQVFVFVSDGHRGTPTETDEAQPLWFDEEAVPFDEMWEDDRLWFDFLLREQAFRGRFFFDGDAMGDFDLERCSLEDLSSELSAAEERLALTDPG
ncbi:MAG: 8-oxo-dGTP diphosphatase [Acidobacteriota bacterium]